MSLERSWVWVKANIGPSIPILAIPFFILMSGSVYVLAKYFGSEIASFVFGAPDPDSTFRKTFLGIISELSGMAFTASVTGGILKVLLLSGYFENALANIVFGEGGIDNLTEARRLKLWKDLTCRIHAPHLHSGMPEAGTKTFYTKLFEAEGRQIEYNESFYVERINRDLSFELDAQMSVVRVVDFTNATFVPFGNNKEIIWTSTITAGDGYKISDVSITDSDINIEGEDLRRREVISTQDGKKVITKHFLSGRSIYKVSRKRTWILPMGDPIFGANSPYLIDNGIFTICNRLPASTLIFQELGGKGLFRVTNGESPIRAGEVFRCEIYSVLLPRQGFQIIINQPPA